MAWKKGPLPPDTYHWGGVVPFDLKSLGFYFADFFGDHVMVEMRDGKRRLEPHEVAWYDNSLELPPRESVATADAEPGTRLS
jgi:hypothetical protein